MPRAALLAAAWLVPLLAPPSPVPKESLKDLLAEAEAKSRASKPLEAAALYGQAIALGHRNGDLLQEQEAAEAFLRFYAGTDGDGRREAAAAALAKLDAKRCGAFVSAPLLAGEVLLAEVAKGDGKLVAEAAAVLGWHARNARSGAAIAATASFAAAVKEARGGDPSKAALPLNEVLDLAVEQDWTDLALAAGAELAVLRLKGGDAAGAAAAVGSAAALISPKTERRHLEFFKELSEVRLKDAPEAVLKPWHDAMGYLKKDAPGVGAPDGGAGGDAAGARRESPFGAAVKPGAKTRVLATVSRTKEGFDLRLGWDPKFRSAFAHPPGVRHVTEGGLTLAFADRSVSARAGDPVLGNGPPGADSQPAPGRAFYRLARGETWTLHRDGVVFITR